MYEISCAACNALFEYSYDDYIHLCPFCSNGFIIDVEENTKELITGHFIIQNKINKGFVEQTFKDWLLQRYHSPQKIDKEFKILSSYCIYLPFWVVAAETHTFWAGYSLKARHYPGQTKDYKSQFLKEEGHFSKKYRWCILARQSPKEHWGIDRLHHPKESIFVDWDGFPLDESVGISKENNKPIYDTKSAFKFELTGGEIVAGIQVKESAAISRAKDQINEYHRRLSKSKVGTLYEYKNELEVLGIHIVHMPFWIVRYLYNPQSVFKYFTNPREKRVLMFGPTGEILEGESALTRRDKALTNTLVAAFLFSLSFLLAVVFHPLFMILAFFFMVVGVSSAFRMLRKDTVDEDLVPGRDTSETVK
jgi:hypothetical protein